MDYFIRRVSDKKEPIESKNLHPFIHEGIQLLAWEKREKKWQVIEVTTGLLIDTTDDKPTKAKAISSAKSYIDRVGAKRIKEQINIAYSKFNPHKISNVMVV